MKLSERDKFLIREAFEAGGNEYYINSAEWLKDIVDDAGHTVEHHLAYDAVERHGMGHKKCQ